MGVAFLQVKQKVQRAQTKYAFGMFAAGMFYRQRQNAQRAQTRYTLNSVSRGKDMEKFHGFFCDNLLSITHKD